ncbi:molybdopterin binding domain protein [Thioalkalivibrio sp. K90mix]|uniref:competence/damage-inducible protein A n=1 Tax=unclassified Thioalkalivibrio TaxID=2621013 RepID=UPI000195AB48|nr:MULTISPECIES: molybdopterin-binding protein [unclassified Thioalkalivibrio]ADC70769.1 molybdopterin binding domain protein [Thioalkalivibrio sp. K90mix]
MDETTAPGRVEEAPGDTEIGAVIIGDELLSGKRRDRHQEHLTAALAEKGLELAWIRIVGDHAGRLTQTFRETLATGAEVFSFGGIGATPDDRTRACLAKALGLPLRPHPDFMAILEERFGAEAWPHRVRMAELPEGASLIPNPVNGIPGLSCGRHHCVPGFPVMAEPMVRWVLDQRFPGRDAAAGSVEEVLVLENVTESRLVPVLEAMEAAFPDLRISCLPRMDRQAPQVELGLRGPRARVTEGQAALRQHLIAGGFLGH